MKKYDRYEVVCDGFNNSLEDIENGRINIDLYIKPPPKKWISLTCVITKTDVVFIDEN